MPEQDQTSRLVFDASVNTLPFDHGSRITFSASDTRQQRSLLGVLGSAADRLGATISGEILVLMHAAGFEKELRAVGLLDFWKDAGAAPDALVIAKLSLGLSAGSAPAAFGRLRAKAAAEAELTIAFPTPSLSARAVVVERLAQAIRLPHMISEPLERGEVVRLGFSTALSLNVAMSDRLAITVDRAGERLSLRRSAGIRGAGRVTASASAFLTLDVRRAEDPGDLIVEMKVRQGAAANLAATAEIRAVAGISGFPDNTREIAGVLLEGLGDAAEPAIDEIEEIAPDLFDTLDEILARAGALQVRAALEASLQRSITHGVLARVILPVPQGADALRRLSFGDLSVLFDSTAVIRSAAGTVRDEMRRRRDLQLRLLLPGSSTRILDRRTLASALIRKVRLLDDGSIDIDVTGEVKAEHTRTRFAETLRTLFTMSVGGTSDALDGRISVPTIRTIRWTLAMKDGDTEPQELSALLRRVHVLGFEPQEGWFSLAGMPRDEQGRYGAVAVNLDLKFSPERFLASIAAVESDEPFIRESLRRAILVAAHTGRHSLLQKVAWAFWTDGVRSLWSESRKKDAGAFLEGPALQIAPIRPSPIEGVDAPKRLQLSAGQRRLLDRLYLVEQQVVDALGRLHAILDSGNVEQEEMQHCTAALGGALEALDAAGASPETLFYVLHRLQCGDGADAVAATLAVSTKLGDVTWRRRVRLISRRDLDIHSGASVPAPTQSS